MVCLVVVLFLIACCMQIDSFRRVSSLSKSVITTTLTRIHRSTTTLHMSSEIRVIKEASDADLEKMKKWPTWGCEVSKFPWTYGEKETCLLIEGKVTVTPTGGQPVSIQKGDIAIFPAGMSCTWDVTEAIQKHYRFS